MAENPNIYLVKGFWKVKVYSIHIFSILKEAHDIVIVLLQLKRAHTSKAMFGRIEFTKDLKMILQCLPDDSFQGFDDVGIQWDCVEVGRI